MKLSNRITTLSGTGSDGWDLFRRARALEAKGMDVVDLTIGDHDRPTSPAILDAMAASAHGGHTGYATLPGTDGLRDAIAARVTDRTGVETRRENIIVTAGGQAALFAAHAAACDPGDAALFIDPYYATYAGTVRAVGARAVPVAAHPRDGFLPDAGEIDRIASDTAARSLLINSPNNPTGAVYDRKTLQSIVDVAGKHDLWLISDEVYETQVWSGTHISPRALPGGPERTLVVGSMSKGHAMTGSRLGWIVGPAEAIAALEDFSVNTTYGVPGFIQDAAEFALAEGAALEDAVSTPFRQRHAAARDLLTAQGIDVVPSEATMYVMADIRPTGLTGDAFAEHLLDTAGVAVMPGESFGDAAAGHVRIALTVEDARLMRALQTLADLVQVLTSQAA